MLDSQEIFFRRTLERMTQEEFAAKLGISRARLNELEHTRGALSQKIEAKYDAIYKGARIASRVIEFTRGVDCPFCANEQVPERLMADESDPEGDYWRCRDCGKRFTSREAWRKASEDAHKRNPNHD